jgi:hypothetical protein
MPLGSLSNATPIMRWPSSGLELPDPNGQTLPLYFARHFAGQFPDCHGDNCLLTSDSAFVDLAFSRLLA